MTSGRLFHKIIVGRKKVGHNGVKLIQVRRNKMISPNKIKYNQIKSNQIKSNQIKSKQIKSNQIKSNQSKSNKIK